MARCPVCERELPEPIPGFCEQCSWDLENDITLVHSSGPIPESIRADYLTRLRIMRGVWKKGLQVAGRQRELERGSAEQDPSRGDGVDRPYSSIRVITRGKLR